VLVNNAGNFFAGFFEELAPDQVGKQIETNHFGPMNVTRAVLPAMRAQRSGRVISISSTAGIAGQAFCSAYAASKFGVEGWMESLRFEVERKANELLAQVDAYRELSSALAFEPEEARSGS
jgi:NAD(P)-dependent dehydrogenase (short-subunit alcohol dehydrogenase family)